MDVWTLSMLQVQRCVRRRRHHSSLGHYRHVCGRAELLRFVIRGARACDHELMNPPLVVVKVSCVLMWSGSGNPD
jgi:hypothetical protein